MIVFGRKCFEYVLTHTPLLINEVYLSKEIDKKLFSKIKTLKIPIIRIDNKKAQSLARGGNHQGMFLSMQDMALQSLESMLEYERLMVLCNLNDIGNIGSIIRSAYALGIDGIILCDRGLSRDALSGIFRASSGALLKMPLCLYHSSLDIINILKMKGFSLFGGDIRGSSITSSIPRKWTLFMGQEDIGLTRRLLEKMDYVLSVEMRDDFDSLNVSVAAGILIDRLNNMQKRH